MSVPVLGLAVLLLGAADAGTSTVPSGDRARPGAERRAPAPAPARRSPIPPREAGRAPPTPRTERDEKAAPAPSRTTSGDEARRRVPPALPHLDPKSDAPRPWRFGPWRIPSLDEVSALAPSPLDAADPDSPLARVLLGLALGALVWLLGTWAERARGQLATTGLIPTLLALLARLAGLGAAAVVLWGTVALFPRVAPELRWGLVIGVGAIVVFAARGVLPDAFSGLVLVLERRVRPNMRIEGEGFAGSVVRIGWRSTVLRGSRGTVEVPNRQLLSTPVRTSPSAEHELVLHLPTGRGAAELRRAIEDAVLASAWASPLAAPRVHRDPSDPRRWVVRVRLLEAGYAPEFDARLPEQLQSVLDGAEPRPRDRPAAPF